MITAAITRKRVVSGTPLEDGWASVDGTIGEAIDVVTKISDEVGDEMDDVVEIKLDDVVEVNWDVEVEETAVVTIVLELAPMIVREEGKLSVIVTWLFVS